MPRYALESTLLTWVAYRAEKSVLEVEFRDGSRYCFCDVPASCLQQLLTADSKGIYFNRHIRNRYPFQRVSASGASG